MDLQFFNSRNGQLSCSADGRYLHSSFNPEIEAQRFIQSFQCAFEPSSVVVLGACLPWCIAPLRARFPQSKLIAVQYDARFKEHSSSWDAVYFVSSPADAAAFGNALFNLLGEEELMTAQFLSWKPSEAVWPEENRMCWEALKNCMEKAQSVLTTRNHFNLRWFKNTVRNLSSIKTFSVPERVNKPVLVTASGPSLENVIPFIKKNRDAFVLMAASSSIKTLLSHDIVPDLCISTDGGWYATRHLRSYQTDSRLHNVPLVISAESAVQAPLLSEVPIMLLSYSDAIETILAEECGIPATKGLRNGTVSGTAAALAASLTTANVYICGLDLAPGTGYQHAEPNENDIPLFTAQSRIQTLETSQSASRFSSGSLALYREWFSNQDKSFTTRIFRLISEKDSLEPLGSMKDIFLEKIDIRTWTCFSGKDSGAETAFKTQAAPQDNASKIRKLLTSAADYIEKHPEDMKCRIWYSSLSLKPYINWLRMDKEAQKESLTALSEETASLIKEVAAHV